MNRNLTNSCVFVLIGIFFLMQINVQAKIAATGSGQTDCFAKLTKEDMESLLKDVSPAMVKRLEDPDVMKQQIKSVRELLAVACAARKAGLADDSQVIAELENIRIEQIATNYDREINKDKGLSAPFGFIGEERIKGFWNAEREKEFQKFIDVKVAEMKTIGSAYLAPSEDDVRQAREYFAKTRIYAAEAETKWSGLSPDFRRKTELAVKLQQAQYLSRIYAKKVLEEKAKVTDAEVQAYIAAHTEFDTKESRARAEKILQRAKSGENFANLAIEFSEDPGSKENGGLYENVQQGLMVAEFEQASLALENGQIAPNLVETQFGFHIIKLEKKSVVAGADGKTKQVYDVRHILIMTTVKDPNYPMARQIPAKEFVRGKLEGEKQQKILDEIIANNPVEIAENFELPKVSDEQMRQLMQQAVQEKTETVNETMPKNIKSYLDRFYKGWKLSPTGTSCPMAANNGIVKGNFNADKKFDYAVKFTRGRKGYVITFLAFAKGYKAFVFRNFTADEANNSSLKIWNKGSDFPYGDNKLVSLKYDAPVYQHCETGASGMHLYQNGKFTAY